MLLSVRNLEVCYGVDLRTPGRVARHRVAGEIVTLIGSNGAGKTTLLRTISGLLRPDRAAPSIGPPDGERLDQSGRDEAARDRPRGCQPRPEGRQVFPNLTVRENLLLGAYQQTNENSSPTTSTAATDHFPVLAERRDAEGRHALRRRAADARDRPGADGQPKLLLLDEPSLGLAPLIVRKIFQIIREINAEGTTIFLVEQNAHMALDVAHRAYVLQTGRVIKSDTASALLEDPDVKKAYLGG